MPNQNNENASRSTIKVPAAASGAEVVVNAAGAEQIAFDFELASANVSRAGNDLVFELDNGGSVKMAEFFEVAENAALPKFVLADNTVVDSEDILSAFDLDLTPAADAAAPGSGLNAYNSDPGNLVGGLDLSGDLDPFFWGGVSDRPEEFVPGRYPGGSFDFDISTDMGGAFSALAYEDASPFAYKGDDTTHAARINMNINPDSGSTVGEIRFSGLPEGAKLYIGDPADGVDAVTPDANGVYHFSASDFSGAGVYIIPPLNSDVDIKINVSVDFTNSGLVASVDGSFTVIVDAVADRPDFLDAEGKPIDSATHSMSKTTVVDKFEDGYNKQAATVSAGENEGKVSITLTVTSEFSDYTDGSEAHYVLVELPKGFEADGNYRIYTDASDGDRQYIMVPADKYIDANTGQVTVQVTLTSASLSQDYDKNTPLVLKTGAMAVEEKFSGGEFNHTNDVSVVIGDTVPFYLDVVDSALGISMGWASEGNKANDHKPSGGNYDPDLGGIEDASVADRGAPIVIQLDANALGSGSADQIDTIVLTVEAGRGVLVDANGKIIEPDVKDGNTYTFKGPITDGQVYFQPAEGSRDFSDVSVNYTVTVSNGVDATATYSGTASVVIDAVANHAVLGTGDVDYGSDGYGAMSAAKPGGTVELKLDVEFPDSSGKEDHYVLINAKAAGVADYGKCVITMSDGSEPIVIDDLSDLRPNADGFYEISVPSNVNVTVNVAVTAKGDITADTPISVGIGGKAVVPDAADREYDSGNNESINVKDVTFKVNPANSTAKLADVDTYEANADGVVMPNKHGVTGTLIVKGSTDISGSVVNVTKPGDLGNITFSLTGGGDSSEVFTKVQFTVDGKLDDLGSLSIGGAPLAASCISYTYAQDGVTVVSTTITISYDKPLDSSLSELTLKFTPSAMSDVDLKITGYTLDYINANSHDKGEPLTKSGSAAAPLATVIVDAVAAKADVNAVDSDDVVYREAPLIAKPGDEVKVKFGMTVPEAGDQNETHGLTLQVDGNNGYNSVTLYGGADGPLTIKFDAPASLTAGTSAGNIVVTDGSGQPVTGFTVEIVTINTGGDDVSYYKISGTGFETYLDQLPDGKVTGEISFNAATSGTGPDGNYSPESAVGMLIVDAETDSSNAAAKNNVSYSEETYSYDVAGVASVISLSVTSAFENSSESANIKFVSRADLLAAIENAGSDPQAAAEAVQHLQQGGSAITVSGLLENGEERTSKAVFVADYPGDKGGAEEAPGQFMYKGVLVELPDAVGGTTSAVIDGQTVTCTVSDDGKVTVTIDNFEPGAEGSTNLYFVPGENYNHNDVTIDYGITVIDPDSNQEKLFASEALFPSDTSDMVAGIDYDPSAGKPLTVDVDAVAQRPDITDIDIKVLDHADANTVPHGSTAAVSVNIDMHGDYNDSTESHFFYVKTVSNDYPVKSITIQYAIGYDGEGKPIYCAPFEVSADDIRLQQTNLGVDGGSETNYHSINLGTVITNHGGQPMAGGEIVVTVNVGTPGSGAGSTINVGVSAHENWTEVQSGWEAGSKDTELELGNNHAWNSGSVEIKLSSASQPSMTLDNVAFYENNNAIANEGGQKYGAGIGISFDLGDENDVLTSLEVSLKDANATKEENDANAALGDLIIFKSSGDYADFQAALAKFGDSTSPYYGKSAHVVLDMFIAEGKAANMGDKIELGDTLKLGGSETTVGDLVVKNSAGELEFGGKVIFMPAEDSYSGQDPQIYGTIVVRDEASGQYASNGGYKGDSASDAAKNGGSGEVIADAVAQKPSDPTFSQDSGSEIKLGGTRSVTINATFGDMDSGTDNATGHYILVEAKAGWSLSYKGETLNLSAIEMYEEGGTVYYKIPVNDVMKVSGDTGTASIEIELKAPSNSLYYKDGYSYDFEVRAGSTDNDLRGGELTFHNNNAVSDEGTGLSGTVKTNSGGSNVWHFRQTEALYEDNNPDSNLASDNPNAPPVGGRFEFGSNNCKGGYAIIECAAIKGEPIFTIEGATWTNGGWKVDLNSDGNASIKVTLSDAYLKSGGANNDADLNFDKITLYNKQNSPKEVIDNADGQLGVVVDAVADRAALDQSNNVKAWDSATDANRLADNIAGGGDDHIAKFTVQATFPDTDTSEKKYVLVEKMPAWELDGSGDVIYLTDENGEQRAYYKIDVTGEVKPDGTLSYEVGMKYVGAAGDIFGVTEKGVTDYEFKYGTMSQEMVGNSGETNLQNNIAVNLEGSVTLKYSPITSNVQMSVVANSTEEGENNFVTLSLKNSFNTEGTQDQLVDLTIECKQGGGAFWLVAPLNPDNPGAPVSKELLTPNGAGKYTFTGDELNNLLNKGYTLVFEQNDYNHDDISFSWSGTVKDLVSGVTEVKSGSSTIVMDAVAQASSEKYATGEGLSVADAETNATGVMSGHTALVTITASFPDTVNVDNPFTQDVVEGSEEHWVVLEQSDLRYNVTGAVINYEENGQELSANATVVTKFGPDGTPYFAVQVPAGKEVSVVFSVTTPENISSDTEIKLNGGTITIENTKDSLETGADREPDYSDNWTANIGKDSVVIQVGVLETKDVTLSAQTNISEGDYSKLTFAGIEAGYNEKAAVTISNLPEGVTLYYLEGGEYKQATSPLTITYHDEKGVTVPDQQYYVKADKHFSGTVKFNYSSVITDMRTGETKTTSGHNAQFIIKGVASESELSSAPDGGYNAVQSGANAHMASVQITASFADIDGSENHYLLFSVPAGMQVDGATSFTLSPTDAKALGIPAGTYYTIGVSSTASSVTTTVNLSAVGSAYNPAVDTIKVWSMSQEKTNVATGGKYAISEGSTINIGDLNTAITLGQPHEGTLTLNDDWTACGNLGLAGMFSDADGDKLSYSLKYGENTYALGENGVDIPGQYGTLNVDADATYTYSPADGQAIDSFHLENFTGIEVIATDGYGSSMTSTANIDFDMPLSTVFGSTGDDSITAESGGLTIYGGAGNDTITAHEDGSVIFGGTGNDTMYAGDGNDVFAWRDGDLEDGGHDTIVGFDMTGDKLFIEGLLIGDNAEEQADALTGMLSDGDLILSMSDASTIKLTYEGQEVELQLKGALSDDQYNSITSTDNQADADSAKAQLLMNILNSSM